ncbi:MAG: hypothetical protein AAGK37_06560 [Pseudomonadota bacterium]
MSIGLRLGGRGGGALLSLALLFLLSGALRLWDGTGAAIAREVVEFGNEGGGYTGTMPTCEVDPGLEASLAAVQSREARLSNREAALEDRLRALEVAERSVSTKLEELQAAEASLRATMSQSQTAAEEDLTRLTALYESMKPQDASLVFAQMAPEFAAGFLGRMRADAAAAIMAGLEPATAYSITVLIAGRNARAPVE